MWHDPNTTNGVDPVMRPFVDFWTEHAQRFDNATREVFDMVVGQSETKKRQRAWLDAVSQSMDAAMRTPAFLQAMKHNTDAIIQVKQHVTDLFAEFARNANIPTTSDISGLFERLHCSEEAILGKLSEMENRLQRIEEGMGAGTASQVP